MHSLHGMLFLWAQIEKGALERIMAGLDDNIPARKTPLSPEELPLVKGLQLLTMKPVRAHYAAQACSCPHGVVPPNIWRAAPGGNRQAGTLHASTLPVLLTEMPFCCMALQVLCCSVSNCVSHPC